MNEWHFYPDNEWGRAQQKEDQANAQLRDAAPELLEAAKLGRLWMLSHPMNPANSLAQIDEAIAKAEGGES